MNKLSVLTLIDQNIDAAFDELDKVFQKTNATYNDLSRWYVNQSNDFSLDKLRGRLKRLVSMDYIDSDPVPKQDREIDYYGALCQLDFKQQTNFFKKIYKYKRIAPFLLHGKSDKEESDLKWLYNQILYTEDLLNERSVIIDFDSKLGGTFERLLDELYHKFGINNTLAGNKPLAVLRNAIQKRLETGPFVCIVKNATKFLWDEIELCKLFEQLLNYLDQEIVIENSQHSFILLFIDSGASNYKNQYTNYFFWFDESEASGFSHNAVSCKDMRIFDLSPIGKIDEKDIRDWIDWSQNFPAIYQQTVGFNGKEKSLLKEGDTPFEVIKQICTSLQIQMDNTWIR